MKLNLANRITVARMLIIPVFLLVLLGLPAWNVLSIETARYVATAIFIIAAATDFLDGYIARSKNMVTNFGKFMDPLADKLLVAAALIALVELKNLYAWVVILIISREFIITGLRTIAADNQVVIAASKWGKFKTMMQMIMIICLLLNFKNNIFQAICSLLVFLSVVLTIVSAVDYFIKNYKVLKEK